MLGPVHTGRVHSAPAVTSTHSPSAPQVLEQVPAWPQSPRRSTPSGMGVHLPGDEGSAHEWQPLSQASLQQTPSTQKPLGHSAPLAQVFTSPSATSGPFLPFVHVPSMQTPCEQGLPFGLRGAVQAFVASMHVPGR